MPGVVKVITHKDVKGKNRITGLITFPTNKGDGWDRPILCDTKVFQYGDAIAIVCADTIEQAKAAAEKVKVELEDTARLHERPGGHGRRRHRDPPRHPERLLRAEDRQGCGHRADHGKGRRTWSRTSFYLQRQPHLHHRARHRLRLCRRRGTSDDPLEVASACYLHLYMIAPGIGIEPDKLRMIQNPAGGTFGYKFSPTMEALLGVAAMATERPVYLELRLHQQYMHVHRQALARSGSTSRWPPTRTARSLAMEDGLVRRPRPVLRVRRPADPPRHPVHRRRLQHPQHPRPRPHRLHQPCLGLGVPRLRLAAGLPGLRESWWTNWPRKSAWTRSSSATRTSTARAPRPRPARTPEVYSFEEMFDKLRPMYHEAKEKAPARIDRRDQEGRRRHARHLRLRPRRLRTAPRPYVELTPDGVIGLRHLAGPRPGRRHRHPRHRPRGPAPAGHPPEADQARS